VGVAGFVMAKTTRSAHSCSMQITEHVRNYAAEQGIAEEEALKKGMEAKLKEFVEKGAEVYAKV
jgi:phosphomethylpyrimidine synthase